MWYIITLWQTLENIGIFLTKDLKFSDTFKYLQEAN